jgi:hypothetical protein
LSREAFMKRAALLLLFVAIALVAGCGSQSAAPTSPSALSSLASGSVPIDLMATATTVGPEGLSAGIGVLRPIIGIVDNLEGTCPASSFTLSGIRVLVSERTSYEGGTCTDLVEGVRAGAIGIRRDARTLEALRVRIAPLLPPLPPPVVGQVTSVSGVCPTIEFAVAGVTVRTGDGTDFYGGVCADVVTGVRLAVSGTRGTDGVLLAEHVRIPPPLTIVQGIVSALGGTCPNVSFALLEPRSRAGTTVLTGDRTRFVGAGCTGLRNGLYAGAVGLINARGALEARGVKIAPPR